MGIKPASILSRYLVIALLSCIVQCSPLIGYQQNVPVFIDSNENVYWYYVYPYVSSESDESSQTYDDVASNDEGEEDYVYEEDEDITPYLPEEFLTPTPKTSAEHEGSKGSAPAHYGAVTPKGAVSRSSPGKSEKASPGESEKTTITKDVKVTKVQPPPPSKFKAAELTHFQASLDRDVHEREMMEPRYWPPPQRQLPPSPLNIYDDYRFLTGQLPSGTITHYQSEYVHGRDDWEDRHYEKFNDFQPPAQAQKTLKVSGYNQQPQQWMYKQDPSFSIPTFDAWK